MAGFESSAWGRANTPVKSFVRDAVELDFGHGDYGLLVTYRFGTVYALSSALWADGSLIAAMAPRYIRERDP
jgi:hypothetical protein